MTQREWEQRAEDGDGQFAIACALLAVARAIELLGNADAASPMGAIEGLAVVIKESSEAIAGALSEVATMIGDQK